MRMHFGLFLNTQFSPNDDLAQRARELLEQVKTAQTVGFTSVFVGQHYMAQPYTMFQPVPLLGAIAATANDMTIGTAILLLALRRPIEVAEEVATLDALCAGHFVLGVGLGYRHEEFELFDVPKQEASSRLTDHIATLRELWSNEPSMTIPSTHCVSAKGPPIWVAANSDTGVRRAARIGDTWLINPHTRISSIKRQLDVYRESLKKEGKNFPTELPIVREACIAQTTDEAQRRARPFLESKYQTYVQWGQSEVLPQDDTLCQEYNNLEEERFIIGDVSSAEHKIRQLQEQLGVTQILFRVQWPGMPTEWALESIEFLGRDVLQKF